MGEEFIKSIDMKGQTALITGATMGIGLATALQYGQAGAQTVITHRWGTVDEDEIIKQFNDVNSPLAKALLSYQQIKQKEIEQ